MLAEAKLCFARSFLAAYVDIMYVHALSARRFALRCRIVAYLLLLFGVGLTPMVTVEILYAAFLVIDSNVLVTCACLYANEEQYAKAAVGIGVSREVRACEKFHGPRSEAMFNDGTDASLFVARFSLRFTRRCRFLVSNTF